MTSSTCWTRMFAYNDLCRIVIALVLLGFTADTSAQSDLPYSSGSTGADGPLIIPAPMPARTDSAAAYDEARQQAVLFGGYSWPSGRQDTWVRIGERWVAKTPSNAPSGRFGHCMAYDPVRQVVLLFGGGDNETWTWNGTNWTLLNPATKPSGRSWACMAFDAARQRMVLFGGGSTAETWLWDGTNWSLASPSTSPPNRSNAGMAYDAVSQLIYLHGGVGRNDTWTWNGSTWTQFISATQPTAGNSWLIYAPQAQEIRLFVHNSNNIWVITPAGWLLLNSGSPQNKSAVAHDTIRDLTVLNYFGATDVWNGGTWSQDLDSTYWFDMTSRASGIWNYTSIFVPSGVTVKFRKNATNTPVTWLASGHVVIEGQIDLSGENGQNGSTTGLPGVGGPGGFSGGRGWARPQGGTLSEPTAGSGPGGGIASPVQGANAGNGGYAGVYGNIYLQPLIGGSGGGGGRAFYTQESYFGGNGGGGGGAIQILGSRDLSIRGSISSRGGSPGSPNMGGNGYYAGSGSGGAIRLVADRISGSGSISVDTTGRVRLESLQNLYTGSVSVVPSVGAPTAPLAGANGRLTVTQVAGATVTQPATGNTGNPDVNFDQTGPVTITVTATDIPNGTPVRLRITSGGQTLELPVTGQTDVPLVNGTATFTATVPRGRGTIQASASVTITPPAP